MKQIVLLTIIVSIVTCRHRLAGGITYVEPKAAEANPEYLQSLEFAKTHYHQECNLNSNVKWGHVTRVGFQVVAGGMCWLEVEMSDDNVYEMKIWNKLDGTLQFTGCTQL